MCAKNHLLVFSSFLDIWENVEWPVFLDHPVDTDLLLITTSTVLMFFPFKTTAWTLLISMIFNFIIFMRVGRPAV